MAKPINKHMKTIALKYQTGLYGLNQLARIYKVDKATISRYFKANNITINQHAKEAISALNRGYMELKNLIETENKSTLEVNSTNKGLDINNANMELVEEVIEVVKKNNPEFARGFQALSYLMIERASEILQGEKVTSGDISNISKAVQNMNDTLGVFPKMPSIAQQININNEKNKNKEESPKEIKIDIEFK